MKTFGTLLVCSMMTLCFATQDRPKSDPIETEVANDLNRIQTFFNIARNKIINSNGVEPTVEQKEAFKELESERQEVQKALADAVAVTDIQKRVEALQAIHLSLFSLQEKLTEDILLPHQTTILKQAEFQYLLRISGGNFEVVIEKYYGEAFGMTEEQKRKFQEVRKKQSDEKRALAVEHAKKTREIEAKSKKELSRIFTPVQLRKIAELSGVDLSNDGRL